MPDQSLPQPPELPTTALARQADGPQEAGAIRAEADSMPSTSDTPVAPAPNPSVADGDDAPQRIPYWLQQSERFLRVIVRMYLGLLVCCAPWYPAAWDNNPLFTSSPWLLALVTQGAVRGVVSGLGLLNLWIAIREAVRGPGTK